LEKPDLEQADRADQIRIATLRGVEFAENKPSAEPKQKQKHGRTRKVGHQQRESSR